MSFPPQGISLGVSRAEFDAHRLRHQNPGADEVNVAGLRGLLEDDQHVLDAEVLAIVAAAIAVHGDIAAAHHTRYTDAEARATGAVYTELDGSVNTTADALGLTDGVWGPWNLTATLPVGTIVVSIAIKKLVKSNNVGVREDGSALARSVPALKLEVVVITVKATSSRFIQIMSGDVSDLDTFSVIGYWS